jgi:hypothetical protein
MVVSTSTDTLTALDVLKQAQAHILPPDNWVKSEWLDRRYDYDAEEYEKDEQGNDIWMACSMGAMLLARFADPLTIGNAELAANDLVQSDPEFARATEALAAAIDVLYSVSGDEYSYGDNFYEYDPEAYGDDHGLEYIVDFNDSAFANHVRVIKAFDEAIRRLA